LAEINIHAGGGSLDCGGKRSATPLFARPETGENLPGRRPLESAVAAALCRRSPKRIWPICRCAAWQNVVGWAKGRRDFQSILAL